MNKFNQNATNAATEYLPPVDNEGPYKLHNTQAAVKIPLEQAVISGAIMGICITLIAWLLFDSLEPWRLGLVAFAIVTPVIWFLSGGNWARLVNRFEGWTQLDLNGDGAVAEEPDKDKVTRVEWVEQTSRTSRQTKHLEIPVAPDKFSRLAVDILLRHKNFTFDEFAGRGKLFSDGKLKELQEFLFAHNFIVLKNPEDKKSGYSFTPRGIKLLQSHLPYPVGIDGVPDGADDRQIDR